MAFILLAAPLAATEPAPPAEEKSFVDPVVLKARADALRDAVADQAVSNVSVKTRARGFFDKIPEETLVVETGNYRRIEREPVTGKVGSIEGMLAESAKRLELWKRAHAEPPPPDLVEAIKQARELQESKSLSYDTKDELAPNQMGIFKYMTDRFDGGIVKLNERMKTLGILVGDAFTYATVAHESQHARDRAAGRLSPEEEVAGEISAFRVQYHWIKTMDPRGERMLTLHSGLKLWRDRETDDQIKIALNEAVVYLEHLSDVVSTNGKEEELKKLVLKLGYKDGKHSHGGDEHEHERSRVSASPTSA